MAGSGEKEIEMAVKGEEQPVSRDTARNVYAVAREAVTNALRHGGADHIAIILDFRKGFKLIIMDNGQGCRYIREGNGLSGMRNRAEKTGASLSLSSVPGEGFTVVLEYDASAAAAE